MSREKKFDSRPRLRSGGQTGVDRAALDAAARTGRAYEGWCPKGGWVEDFPHPPGLLTLYPRLTETPSACPEQRTEWNVRDSAATLVLVPHGNYRSQGTDFTIACAKKYKKPCYVVYYRDEGAMTGIKNALSGIGEEHAINIAGSRESEHPGAYQRCLALLIEALGVPCRTAPSPNG